MRDNTVLMSRSRSSFKWLMQGWRRLRALSLALSQCGLRKVQLTMEEGMQLLKLRQKAIKLADRSEFGWSLVAEYDADELADDSDDERKIEKAA